MSKGKENVKDIVDQINDIYSQICMTLRRTKNLG